MALKGRFEYLDINANHSYDIEPQLFATVLVFAQPCGRQAANLALLIGTDRLGWATKAAGVASLDFDEGNRAPFRDDEIELAASAAPVSVEDDPPSPLIPAGGQFLALASKSLPCIGHASDTTYAL